ncbi:MAG: acyl carrier protein [Candidatus Omnitrophica bacterium]|nr:acyl carrier protein [Candidatus Omnitrophota bacterium]MCK5491702.1 acyl carrier protein [Candidatus Omnitrophota bacterium]
MDRKEIEKKVNQVFEESFEIDSGELSSDKGIFEDLGLDSLDIVDLVVALQKKFGVKIRDDNRVREIRKLGDIYNFIESLYKEGNFSAKE